MTEVAPLSPPMVRVTYAGSGVPVRLVFTALACKPIAQGARGRDQHLQFNAIDHPREDELALGGFHEGAGRDGDGEGAGVERDRLDHGIDRGRGAAQGEAGLQGKRILVGSAAEECRAWR